MDARWYTGVGSRETPRDVLDLFTALALALGREGWILRSGAAQGADSAFEAGAWAAHRDGGPRPQVFLPWPGFEDRSADEVVLEQPSPHAFDVAQAHHPAWDRLRRGGRALHARNVHQVVGLFPIAPSLSTFLVCWTPNGAGGGGTGQAIRLARHYGVPVFDVALPEARTRVERFAGAVAA